LRRQSVRAGAARKIAAGLGLALGLLLGRPSLSQGNLLIQIEKPFAAKSVRGVVVDPSGAAIAGVKVRMAGPKWQGELARTVTDSNGRFDFHKDRPGKYFLEFSKPGFDLLRIEVIVKESKSDLRIEMWVGT
jgi:carboxypeptidase family protein